MVVFSGNSSYLVLQHPCCSKFDSFNKEKMFNNLLEMSPFSICSDVKSFSFCY